MKKSEIILYQTESGQTKLEVRLENETVWHSQQQMSELFQRERSVITKHINNIFTENELQEESNVQFLHIANSDKSVKFYAPLVRAFNSYPRCSYRLKSVRIRATSSHQQ